MEQIDLLRKSDLDWLQKKGDEALKFNETLGGRIAEAADGLLIALFVSQLNKFLTPKIPDNVKVELHDVFDNVVTASYQNALIELSDVVEKIIENNDIDSKLKPWLLAIVEIYKGIIEQLTF
jgi:hypothetical protein